VSGRAGWLVCKNTSCNQSHALDAAERSVGFKNLLLIHSPTQPNSFLFVTNPIQPDTTQPSLACPAQPSLAHPNPAQPSLVRPAQPTPVQHSPRLQSSPASQSTQPASQMPAQPARPANPVRLAHPVSSPAAKQRPDFKK